MRIRIDVGQWEKWKNRISMKLYNIPFDWCKSAWREVIISKFKKMIENGEL